MAYLFLVRSMRKLVERFSYRFQLWRRERYGDYSPADPTARNPLRFVALVAVMSVILGVIESFVFHRAFDLVAIIDFSVAVASLALYQSKSRWAWHLVIAWVPFTLVLYWIFDLVDTRVISRVVTLWRQKSSVTCCSWLFLRPSLSGWSIFAIVTSDTLRMHTNRPNPYEGCQEVSLSE